MGIYINKGNEGFRSAINGEYVDKTGMIDIINKTLNTERRYSCVTRSRRFGKSMAVDMLCAYYDKSCDSRQLFDGLTGFSNDMHDIRSKNDVFTVLIHLGYLAYDKREKECFIPNKEVRMEMINAVESCKNGPEGKKHTCAIERITK